MHFSVSVDLLGPALNKKVSNFEYIISASAPLKCYVTSDVESNEEENDMLYKPRKTTFYRMCDPAHDKNNFSLLKHCNGVNQGKSNEKSTHVKHANLPVGKDTKIYDSGACEMSPEIRGRGKYMFKPRLKYTNCNQFFEIDKSEKEKLYVINSYKHCSGKSILPASLSFDDPEKFSNKFAAEFLCSSTPRQTAKHLTLDPKLSLSVDSIDADF